MHNNYALIFQYVGVILQYFASKITVYLESLPVQCKLMTFFFRNALDFARIRILPPYFCKLRHI